MKQIQRILVVLDSDDDYSQAGSEMPIELQKALRLVKDKDATELHLFCAAFQEHLNHDTLSWDFDQDQRRVEYCAQLTENVAHLATALRKAGYKSSSDVVWAYPRYEAVIAKANEINADIIVQHTRSYGKLELHHLTNDSWQLVKHCAIPLLLVKNNPWHAKPRLIAAVDPVHSHHKPLALDNLILDAALVMQERLSGELNVVHAYAEAARPFAPAGVIRTGHREALDELLSSYSISPEQLHFMDETAIAALQQKTRELQTDILVMGAISRSRLSEMLVGSTAEKVLDFLGTDVLVIKPDPAAAASAKQ
ncbi:MAG: universal stress protein [Pseudohongiellaceae bacterium]